MNLKKKLRDFFTLSRKANGGFTLVELIVVIAILAILGGVAVPAYSGYVKKANLAADQTLLNAVNKAFASACAENGTDTYNVPEQPELKLTADRAVDEVTLYTQEFDKYFAGNEDAKFKTDNTIVFDSLKGSFVLMVDGTTVSLKYGDGYVTISAEDAKKLADSTFNDEEKGLGIEELLNKVNFVADFATGVDSTTYDSIINSPDYQRKFLENLGIDTSEYNDRNVGTMFDDKLAEMSDAMLIKMGKDPATATIEDRTQADAKVKANMAVLYAAQSTGSLTDTQINTLLNTSTPKETILNGASNGENLAQAALYYGMYVSYAHYKGDQTLIDKTDDPLTLLTSNSNIDTVGFQEYLKTDQGKADLEAYKASMGMITDSTANNASGVNNLVVNGFGDADLIALLQQAVGK